MACGKSVDYLYLSPHLAANIQKCVETNKKFSQTFCIVGEADGDEEREVGEGEQ